MIQSSEQYKQYVAFWITAKPQFSYILIAMKKFFENWNRQQQESKSLTLWFHQFITISHEFLESK